jgi:peptidoglycan/LPS O-acetylase OafA/YrhL
MRAREGRIITPKRPSQRIPALDGVRGIAVLAVMLFHCDIFPPGWVGVNIFFALSGFLITRILLDGSASGAAARDVLRAFYMRRALRILALAFLVAFIVGVVSHSGWKTLWHVSYVQNWLRYPAEPRSLGHFWTLAVEEQFYLVWPFVVLVTPLRRLPWICVAMLSIAALARTALYFGDMPFATEHFMRTATIVSADSIPAGALVAILLELGDRRQHLRLVAASLAGGVGLLALVVYWYERSLHAGMVYILGETALAAAIASLLAVVVLNPPHWLRWPFLRWIGTISYGLYVFHGVLASWLRPSVPSIVPRFVLIFGLSFALATFSWRFFEAPILRQKWRWPMPGQSRPERATALAVGGTSAEIA